MGELTSVSALNNAGATDDFTYVSTAGDAFLEWLEGKQLPGVIAGLVPVIHVSADVELRWVRGGACWNDGLSVWRNGSPGQSRG